MNTAERFMVCASANRVLVVDDEEPIRFALKATLGFEVMLTEGVPQALERIQQEEFAVVLSDYKMTPVDGLEFLKAVGRVQPNCSRLMLTGFADVTLMIQAINQGEIYRFLVKPWIRDELVNAVREASQCYRSASLETALQAEMKLMNEELRRLNGSLSEQLTQGQAQKRELERLNGALHENLRRSVELCLHTLQTFHPSLGINARRVRALCSAMADDLRLPADQWRVLEIGALLHDIGLLGVHRDLIDRWRENPEGLSDAEQALIQHHPVIGEELAGFSEDLKDVGTIIRAHHERHDGYGYPDGLQGDDIPWLARLLAVAVRYAEHQYKGRDAVFEITATRGAEFDPEAVRALVRSLPQAVLPRQQKGLLLSELQPGMVLATSVYNTQGLLIFPEGRPLTENWIAKLKAHDRVSPLNQSLQVFA